MDVPIGFPKENPVRSGLGLPLLKSGWSGPGHAVLKIGRDQVHLAFLPDPKSVGIGTCGGELWLGRDRPSNPTQPDRFPCLLLIVLVLALLHNRQWLMPWLASNLLKRLNWWQLTWYREVRELRTTYILEQSEPRTINRLVLHESTSENKVLEVRSSQTLVALQPWFNRALPNSFPTALRASMLECSTWLAWLHKRHFLFEWLSWMVI